MINDFIYDQLQKKLKKKQQELIRLKWEKQKWESAVRKLKEQNEKRTASSSTE